MSQPSNVKMGSNVAISIIAAAAVLLMINYLSMRHHARADWTSAGLYTLSEKTGKVMSALDRDVSLHVLWSQGDPRFPDVKEILDSYGGLSPRLTVEIIDPDLSPERVQLIIQKYGAKVQMDQSGNMGIEAGVFVVSGENVKFVSAEEFEDYGDDMMMTDPETGESMSEFKAEQELTSAIMRVSSDDQMKICFTQGHGERAFDGYGAGSLGHVKEELKRDSYQVEAIATAGAGSIPEACHTVVVAGPKKAFMEGEVKALEQYLKNGGRAVLLLDPILEDDRFASTGLEQLTVGYGIKLNNDLVLETDPRRLVSDTPVTFLASNFGTHEAVKPLNIPDSVGAALAQEMGAMPVVFSMVRSLEAVDGRGAVSDVLAKTSPMSWGEVDLGSIGSGDRAPEQDQYDTDGPAIIAMAAVGGREDGSEAGRLLVVGDSDFLEEELFVNASLFNRDFWTSMVGWITAREDLISIAGKNPEHVKLSLTEENVSTIWWVVGGELFFIILIGVTVWLRRRR